LSNFPGANNAHRLESGEANPSMKKLLSTAHGVIAAALIAGLATGRLSYAKRLIRASRHRRAEQVPRPKINAA